MSDEKCCCCPTNMTGKPSHITISLNQQYLEGTWYRLFDLAPDEHLCIPDFATTQKKIQRFSEGFLNT